MVQPDIDQALKGIKIEMQDIETTHPGLNKNTIISKVEEDQKHIEALAKTVFNELNKLQKTQAAGSLGKEIRCVIDSADTEVKNLLDKFTYIVAMRLVSKRLKDSGVTNVKITRELYMDFQGVRAKYNFYGVVPDIDIQK
jgi:hypothetical protein